jgi:hypothetical protein
LTPAAHKPTIARPVIKIAIDAGSGTALTEELVNSARKPVGLPPF